MHPVTDVQPTVPSPVTETVTAAITAVADAPVFDMDTMSKDERQKLIANGQFPKRLPKVEAKPTESPTVTPAAADKPASAGTETPPESVDEDLEKLTPAERKHRNRGLRKELDSKLDEIKFLREQLAAKPTSAPAAPTKEEPAKPAISQAKPRPQPKDFNGADADEAWAKYLDADGKWMAEEIQRQAAEIVESRFSKAEVQSKAAKVTESWQERIKTATAAKPDWEAIANKAIISPAAITLIPRTDKGEDVLYYLGQSENAEEAERIAAMTDIPGYADWPSLKKAAESNPALRDRVLIAQGMAQAEFNRIAFKLANPPAKPVIEKTSTTAPKPPRAVASSTAPIVDELRSAIEENRWDDVNRIRARQQMEKRFGTK